MDSKIAALVVLYQYDQQVIENIKSYHNQVDIVFAYDNSTKKNTENEKQLKALHNLIVIDGHGNQGISHAVNVAAKRAIAEGYQWLITFDQDSVAAVDMIEKMRSFIETYPQIDTVGIIGPTIKNEKLKFTPAKNEFSYRDWVIQSGALHNLKAYEIIKGYDENLFIDEVDVEYCARLVLKKYRIVILNHAILIHNTLDDGVKMLFKNGRYLSVNKYSPMRYYFIIRNNLYCIKKYKKSAPKYYAEFRRQLITAFLTLRYETDKWSRMKAIVFGAFDFFTNRMGKTKRKF